MSTNSQNKNCQNCKSDFIIESDDFGFYEKIKVPPPTFCPECRAIRRLIWRNERSLYHNTCAFSGKNIISMFDPELKLTVYDREIWWSDKWDPTTYGQTYDFSKPFFLQFKELLQKVPLENLGNTNCINSEYGNHNTDCKNCYLTYATFRGENVAYTKGGVEVKDSLDLFTVMKSEQAYEDVVCSGLYKTHFSYDSDDSINSQFLTSCMNLHDCLGCINLRHKRNTIFNVEYSKEEYEKQLVQYDFGSYKNLETFKKEYSDFIKPYPRRFAALLKSVSVTGDNVMTSKNSKMIFDIFGEVEDSKYITHGMSVKNSYDAYGAGKMEFLYEGVDAGIDASKVLFAVLTHRSMETHYTYMCFSSKYLFGCIGMRKQEYCILNKKDSKEDYEKILPKIIQHMNDMPYIDEKGRVYKYGEFFPADLAPFAYNETIAQEYYPLSKKEAKESGFKWKEREEKNYEIEIKSEELPDHIKDVADSIVGKVIECKQSGQCNEQCTEAFKITLDELHFYRRMNLTLPRLCPNCRHFQRLGKRNPLGLWGRSCMCVQSGHDHQGKCSVSFETPYSPEMPEVIYCEKCYQKEVY
mgnify:CR=1 FL=1